VTVAALVAVTPAAGLACATCVSSAFGDRTYNWAYLGLIIMPFALTAVVGFIVAYARGWTPFTASSVRTGWEAVSLFVDRLSRSARRPT
jgi:hypothetical protein